MSERSELQLGMIGLGRMGANLVRRLKRDKHECVGAEYRNPQFPVLFGRSQLAHADADERALEHALGLRSKEGRQSCALNSRPCSTASSPVRADARLGSGRSEPA